MKVSLRSGRFVLDRAGAAGECLNVLFAGDLCPIDRTQALALAGRERQILEDVMPVLSEKDLSVVNLEATLTTAETPIPKSGPNLKVDPRCISLVKAGRFDVACCANNHVGDYGPAEALKTVQICHDHGIKTVGAGRDLAAARKPLFVERGGICLALLAFAENEFGIAREDAAGSNPLNPLRNIEDIRGAVKRADVTVVLVHGGNEYNPVPSPRMVQTYRAFADAGAAAVIAGHPHCPQGIEVWNGKPIVYSPGNFLFDWQRGAPNRFWWMGYMVRITLARGKACALEVVPYTFGPSAERVVLLRGNERKSFLAYVQHLSHIIPDEEEVRRYWDAWCAMQGPGVLKFLCGVTWPPDPNQEGAVRKLLSTRNIFTCEAHDDLARGFLMMAVEGRVEAGSAYVPRTKALQSGQIPA